MLITKQFETKFVTVGMSDGQYAWFWENYERSMDWINHHEVAFWKSQAKALKTENACLKDAIKKAEMCKSANSVKGSQRKRRKRRHKTGKKSNKSQQQLNHLETAPLSCSDFEVSPELIKFFRTSIQHRMQRKKEKEEREALSSFVPPQETANARTEEMKNLYGDGFSKIMELEEEMAGNFDRFMDRKCPEYWPSLPLNLSL